jgi:hypothetical protein
LRASIVACGVPAHSLPGPIGLPENGSMVPPLSTSRNQRVSLSCWLSARSPVVIANASRARRPLPCRTVLRRLALTLRTVESKTCRPIASCGRHDDLISPPAGSAKSTRAGDISSAIWGSVSWANISSDRRSPARPLRALAEPPRRTT